VLALHAGFAEGPSGFVRGWNRVRTEGLKKTLGKGCDFSAYHFFEASAGFIFLFTAYLNTFSFGVMVPMPDSGVRV